ncbi:MAG: polyphosphate:AMP phosphotransferase [Clostridia bacterium]|nr:polyphosphate:AMP phosphotransferase [Clostridia bacterium]
MLKKFEWKKTEDKEQLSGEIKALRDELLGQQQLLREKKLPILVLIEGWAAAGKGSLIKELISEIDPRFYNVVSPAVTPESEARYPFLYPYAAAIPENGKIMFLDSGWMESTVRKYLRREITQEEYKRRVRSVNEFERQLRDGGYLLLKIFLHIDKKEQFQRLAALTEHADTEWRVTHEDLWQHREYARFLNAYDEFMEKTNDPVKWHILDGSKRKTAVRDAMKLLVKKTEKALAEGRYVGEPFEEDFPLIKMPRLKDVDLSYCMDEETYKKELKKLQGRLSELHNTVYRKKIPVILCYEGWDAAGKGGNIRRVAYPLDPRGFDVKPIASPEPHELNRQYLWRFWTRLPRTGHICIFDRTWYGRVMVERLEGFCSEKDWKRAYNEINEFERQLTDWGAVVLKFWIHIDQETQLARFTERQNTPEKQWKITDEDWRNREKWPQYEIAVDEMLQKTSTENAPWYIIESNDKKYARIKTLKIIIKALEKACEEQFGKSMG